MDLPYGTVRGLATRNTPAASSLLGGNGNGNGGWSSAYSSGVGGDYNGYNGYNWGGGGGGSSSVSISDSYEDMARWTCEHVSKEDINKAAAAARAR
jgi:hypothetical protein